MVEKRIFGDRKFRKCKSIGGLDYGKIHIFIKGTQSFSIQHYNSRIPRSMEGFATGSNKSKERGNMWK
ncbi:hypothetical protein Bache_2108 [Bacteroides helcogenes P 36-108]|uniref:Uncharacterized protein n=1 Tax=Bacteroides helcogenes (strain ATCC 35417 / DSM 20613 / JCM 6297 / CCUG 15421 / P 36-108) TaxID=693979 RepID=E6SRH6_BACT6|nr:hypothetical protein Bache_2108 [Bacteroides helcogenes P 36-108]